MKTIIAGSRVILNYNLLLEAITASKFKITEVVSGGALGVDIMGESYAKTFDLPVKIFEPDWDRYGKGAGPIRNIEMAKYADALIALWDGKSKGTAYMIKAAVEHNLKVFVMTL